MTTESVAPEAVQAGTTDIPATVRRLRETFKTGRTRSLQWRKQQLQALEKLMVENEPAVAAALEQDLGREPFEAWLADIASTAGEAKDAAKNLRRWMRRRYRLLELSQLLFTVHDHFAREVYPRLKEAFPDTAISGMREAPLGARVPA